MNSLQEYLTHQLDALDLTSIFIQNMPSVTPSSQRPEKVMPWKAQLLSKAGTPAQTAPVPSYSQVSSESSVKDQTFKTYAGAKHSKRLMQSLEKQLYPPLSIDLIDPRPGPSMVNLLTQAIRNLEGRPMPAKWYREPEDQMLVFMGHAPRPGAKYDVPW